MEPDQGNGGCRTTATLPHPERALNEPAVLSHLIAQLRPGADLSRVTLPTFILEPRSMLERITKYGAHGRP